MSSSANAGKRAVQAPAELEAVDAALARIPTGLFILTARHEDRRAGMVTRLVQQIGERPPMVSLAIAKGTPIMPLISESRQFGLCQLAEGDKLLARKFAGDIDPAEDPFLGFELLESHLPGLPLLAQSLTQLECELSCHMDVEGDHDLFVGTVRAGRARDAGEPWVKVGPRKKK